MNKWLVFILNISLLLNGCAIKDTVANASPLPDFSEGSSPATANPQPAGPLGDTYHVAVTGNDGNNGSESTPWLTIQHAVDSVQPGDLILVHAGTYAGARIEASGTSAAPLTLQANPGDTPIINQPGPNNRHDSNLELETWEGDGTVSYWIIAGFEVTNAPNWGIDIRGSESAHSHHITIRSNIVHDNGWSNGTTGIFAAFTDYVTIENNHSYHNGEHGIYVNNSSDHFTIRGNLVHHNANSGIHLNGDLDSGGDGLMTDGLVANNIIYENGTGGGAGINMDGVSNSIVQNNLIYQNHASGIAIFQENGAECSQNNRIWHNTVMMPSDGRWAIIIADAACVNNQLYNNIFYSEHTYRGSINLPADSVSGFESDYNIITDRFTTDDGDSILTLAEWQALGYDSHSFIAAPSQLFTDSPNSDFHLMEGSLAIDTGGALVQVGNDLDGNSRPIGDGYDIGAYEFQGGATEETIFLPLVTATSLPPSQTATGHILYRLSNDQHLYRLEIPASGEIGAPEDLTLILNNLAAGSDDWANISPDGSWILLSTERAFSPDCSGWSCLVLLPSVLSSGELLVTPNGVIHPEGFSAVASSGDLVVYPYGDGPHTIDLWAVIRQESGWSAPVLLTASSAFDHHSQPAISADGSTVVFNCDPDLNDGQEGTAICEVGTDGAGFRTVIRPIDGPGGTATNALRHPDYAPDGSIVFEADWYGEQIWYIPPGDTEPIRITDSFNNDNSPCVLPDDRIVSLWLDRAGGNGDHEIKVMSSDGSTYVMALIGLDVFDLGLGCGK